ncbi:MAG: ornithine carbamoyltransferase [Planctomycetota bacterium]|nr:ornithine carbamoyltransferase [Planctomycetota bacterium]
MILKSSTATIGLAHKDLVAPGQFTTAEIEALFATGAEAKAAPTLYRDALSCKTITLLFEKPSLRTRVSFEVGAAKLGGTAIYLDHAASRIGERETIADYARNLSLWTDAIVARTFSHQTIEELALHASIPVINGLSELHHPCQALADFFTMKENFGDLAGLKVAYIGDGNNVCNSLIVMGALLGVHLTVICPVGFDPDKMAIAEALKIGRRTGADLMITDEIEAVHERHVVYTDTWVSMGQADAERRHATFQPYQVNKAVLEMAADDAIFMHCLPAHRGAEVSADVIDSPASAVLQQAENRMHMQNALLIKLLSEAA